jgi:adenylate cyclase
MPAESEKSPKFEIGHVLLIDVVGHSRMSVRRRSKIIADLNEVVRNTARFRVADVAGKVLSLPTDDGMALAFFRDPEAALDCAMEIARAIKNRPKIRLRMGIDSGSVNRAADVTESATLAGAGIGFARRVTDCSDAGHILLSRPVAYELAPIPRWTPHLYELGDCEVKPGERISLVNFYTNEIGNPKLPRKIKRARRKVRTRKQVWLHRGGIGLLILGIAGGIFVYCQETMESPPPPPPPREKSVAVLPFVDLSPARDQDYFCDGISEEIRGALARAQRLRVVGRTSSFSFKGKQMEATEIAKKLSVASVLEGTLRREGNLIRITADLINARDGFHMWSETFERELQDVSAVPDEITRGIIRTLKVKLWVAPRPRPQPNAEAYNLFLQALFFANKSSESDLRKSLDLFQRALDRDPKLGRAWTGIAKAWISLGEGNARPLDAYPKVEAAAMSALALDDRDAEAHAYLGETKRVLSWDIKGAESETKRALALDPNCVVAHLFMASLETTLGRGDEALAQMRAAVRLDPFSPSVGNREVDTYVVTGRLDDAFAATMRTMEIDPNYIYFEPDLALVHREQGKLQEALDIYLRLAQREHQPSAGLAITYVRLGRKEEARKVLGDLIQIADTRYFPGDQIASVYLALGENDEAFRWLDRAVQERSGSINRVVFAPEFRLLRSDSRFPDLLRRIGLEHGRAEVRGER